MLFHLVHHRREIVQILFSHIEPSAHSYHPVPLSFYIGHLRKTDAVDNLFKQFASYALPMMPSVNKKQRDMVAVVSCCDDANQRIIQVGP